MITLRSLTSACAIALLGAASHAQTWGPVGSGSPSAIYALEVFQDRLYAGGTFTTIGGINAHYLATWNGSAWGGGVDLIEYQAADGLYAHDTALYIGDAGRVRRFDGTTWNTLPGVFNSSLYTMGHFNDTLFVGGFFTTQGGHSYPNIARWNGNAYDTLTSGCNAQVNCLQPFDGKLFVAGNFQTAGDSLFNRTALWDGHAWSRMDNGLDDDVFEHCIFQDTLYVGGRFTHANGVAMSRVAKWNGTHWVAVGGPLNDYVTSMKVYHDQLYIGGAFASPSHIARLQGNSWVDVGGGCNDIVRVMEVYHDTLYVGGSFTTAGGTALARIAKWYAPPVPVAGFSLSSANVCVSGCIQLTDGSTNDPTNWSWTFPGGEPAMSTEPAPTVCYSTAGEYTVSLTAGNFSGSTSTSGTITVEVCTAIAETRCANDVVLSPNPACCLLTLRSDGPIGNIELFDAQGRTVLERSISATTSVLDVQDLVPGIYLLRVAGRSTQRVVIEE